MNPMNQLTHTPKSPFMLERTISLLALIAATAAAGCYVVPLEQRNAQPVLPALVPNPAPMVFPARLYPANDLAAGFGVINATVTNDLHGRGAFSATINGEAFTGEATRSATPRREGVANGTGNRGSYLTCTYNMNSATLGTGTCRHSSGAQFSMHLGN
jgi:hypothetical protein